MRRIIAMMLLMSTYVAIADDQGEKISKMKSKYRMGEAVVFKIDSFYSKVCRDKRIPGIELLKPDETVGIIDQFYDGKYRVVKVTCNSDRMWGHQHFDVNQADIVGLYVRPKIEEDDGMAWYWWVLGIAGLAVGIPIIL